MLRRILYLFSLFIIFLSVGNFAPLLASTSTDSMVGYWKMDEGTTGTCSGGSDVCDASGSGLHGTRSGATWVSSPGNVSFTNPYAMNFNGTSQYVSIADNNLLDFANNENFTVTTWVKVPSTQNDTTGGITGDNDIISKWNLNLSTGYPYAIRVLNQTDGNAGKILVARYDGTNYPQVTSSVTVNDNAWHHVAFVKSSSTLRLYIDGTQRGSGTDTTTGTTTNSLALNFGRRSGGSNYFTGQIDDVRIYSRALSTTEITALGSGTHTSATWTGSLSSSFETAGNWDINAIPDPYTNLIFANTTNHVIFSMNEQAASATVNAGALLDLAGYNLTYNDGGSLTINGSFWTNGRPANAIASNPAPATTCGNIKPENSPDLFQLQPNGSSVTLYFVPVSGSNTGYYVSYGLDDKAEGFGTSFDYSDRSGVIPYKVNELFPGTWYFKVRGQNGCMPGNWSQVRSVKVTAHSSGFDSFLAKPVLGASTKTACSDYIVEKGDTLWGISSEKFGNGFSYATIMKENNLTTPLIYVGQKLKLGC